LQGEIEVRLLAPIVCAMPLARWLAATAVDDDFQVVFRLHRCLHGREEVPAVESIARDDAEAPGLISHVGAPSAATRMPISD
jgi:hypothetical protein